ncbi:DUF1203 domain-containing protein [Lysobacter sp. CFH 32150]|uniref:DUF1203 domain-containing protein n=1 Tax=Lysobacter sp. CFH 32150 TaxID=2927128 RepID=UPI001FA806C6|nr:DUF1203 domain-containing protein [Lysobacter sp. CFH 32150]MCI4568118.1 DUF1203 domain-containing protein [Lysobacter sp. CFH 32150]
MNYVISGLPLQSFQPLFALDDDALRERGVVRQIADRKRSFPCRITLQDAEPGESLLLLSWTHQDAATPYRSGGPIFVRESALVTGAFRNMIPEQQRSRLLSVRAYDAHGWMRDAEVAEGTLLESLIERFFADAQVTYLHVHNARRGCYACRVDRG